MIALGLCVFLTLQAVPAPVPASPQLLADAAKGDAEAQFKLGRAYAEGIGVPVDPIKGVALYRRAADQGHAFAQYALGESYLSGEGVDPSDLEGLRWIRKAAEQGNPLAQSSLGEFYSAGRRGVDEDQQVAFGWFHRAASGGYNSGAGSIGNMYEFGEYLPKDYVLAYAWLDLNGKLRVRAGGPSQDDALRELAKKMTKAQLAAATKLIQTWGGKVPPLATVPPQPAPKADAATIALAGKLAGELQRERFFAEATLQQEESLPALAHLALTSKDTPLVRSAYEAIANELISRAGRGRDPRELQPLVIRAIMVGLRRVERPILDKALAAAAAMNRGEQGHTASIEALADMALKHREPDVRYAALNALYQVGVHVASRSEVLLPEVMALAMDDANEGVAYLNMFMFNSLGRMSPAYTARHARIAASLKRLRTQGSQAMRAAAIGSAANMFSREIELPGMPRVEPGADAKAFAAELPRILDDPSPIVRGSAAVAAGLLRFVEGAMPKLVAMLDDPAPMAGAIGGLRSLSDDSPIDFPVRLVGLGEQETVAMAALRALQLRSLLEGAKAAASLECKDPAKTFAECANRARAWGRRAAGMPAAPKAPPTRATWAPPANAVRVGGTIPMPEEIKNVAPEYPEEARSQGASGIVIVEAMIGPKGDVAAVHIVRGIKGLDEAAMDAVRQWVYKPTIVGGKPVPVLVTLTVNFRLQ